MPKKQRQKPRVGRAEFVQDQQRQVHQDRRTKRRRTRREQSRAAVAEYR